MAIAHLIKKTHPSTVLISAQVARAAKETEELLNADNETTTPVFLDAPGYLELVDGPSPSIIPPKYTEFMYGDRDSLILHSSGTTGLPKPIYHAHAYMLTYANNHNLPLQDAPFQYNVSTLPLYHVCFRFVLSISVLNFVFCAGLWTSSPVAFFIHWDAFRSSSSDCYSHCTFDIAGFGSDQCQDDVLGSVYFGGSSSSSKRRWH